jgi:hypothetical protein
VLQKFAALSSEVQSLADEQEKLAALGGRAVKTAQDAIAQIQTIAPSIPGPPGPPGPPGGGAASYELAHEPLSGNNNTTVITAPAGNYNPGDFLTVFLQQPAAGNQAITFAAGPPGFRLATVNDLDRTGNAYTVLFFEYRSDGNFWLAGIPLMGRT